GQDEAVRVADRDADLLGDAAAHCPAWRGPAQTGLLPCQAVDLCGERRPHPRRHSRDAVERRHRRAAFLEELPGLHHLQDAVRHARGSSSGHRHHDSPAPDSGCAPAGSSAMDRPPRRGSLEGVDEHLSEIDEALERPCARVSALERGDHVTARPEPRASIDASHGEGVDGARAISRAADATGVVTLVGRTVVVLGGALLGFAYASTWIGAADLAAIRRPASGFFHGLAGIVIGFPLLIEGATRFGALSATSAAALLLGLAVAILIVSWHRRLQSLAAVTAFAASLTAVVGAITTGHLVPFAAAAIGTGAAASIVCIGRDWHLPAWPPMLAGNLLVIAAAIRSLAPAGLERKGASLTAAIGLAAVYLGLACPSLTPRSVSPRLGDLVRAAISLTGGIGAALLVANDLGGPAFKALG